MKLSAVSGEALKQKTDVLVLFTTKTEKKKTPEPSLFKEMDTSLVQKLSRQLKHEAFDGEDGTTKVFFVKDGMNLSYLALVGLGEKKKFTLETLRKAGAKIQGLAGSVKAAKVLILTDDGLPEKLQASELAQALAEGILLSSYQFERYKKAKPTSLKEVCLHADKTAQQKNLKAGLDRAALLADAVSTARDLVNTAGADATPKTLADVAKKLNGVQVKVYDLNAIKKLKMGAFLSVAKGSTVNPPCFIEMHYRPKKAKKKVALIGKGVTFDSGGYSLKPAKSMETMKDDMSAAAAVLGLMSIISRLKPNVQVSAYIAATENMIDGGAQRPGDVCTAMNGKTIEVLNTDAEGRLTLADALYHASLKKPDYMIDMATLTGACLVALGTLYSGIMGNDQKLIGALTDAGKHAGENIWHLPLPDEYRDWLKSDVADLKNIGGMFAGTLTAGLFLENFVGDTKWAHIDIAGPAWTDSALPYTPKGGTGVMVRTLAHFLEQI